MTKVDCPNETKMRFTQKPHVQSLLQKDKQSYFFRCLLLAVLCLILIYFTMTFGNTVYSPAQVLDVLRGHSSEGAFTIRHLRLPRMVIGLLCGFAFGLSGNTFQRIFHNPLASPDILGISSASALAAVIGILFLKLPSELVCALAIFSGFAAAALCYLLSGGKGFSHVRLILVGIGLQAFIQALISWALLKTASYDVGTAMRWLSGSLNSAASAMEGIFVFALVILISALGLFIMQSHLEVLELGDAFCLSLGGRPDRIRFGMLFFALVLCSFSTARSGPIASVAFLSGPIARRLSGSSNANLLASGLVGILLVLAADFIGQYAFFVRYPVGIISGILGAPYLLFLLIRIHKKGVYT